MKENNKLNILTYILVVFLGGMVTVFENTDVRLNSETQEFMTFGFFMI